jgi:hypothetical protein
MGGYGGMRGVWQVEDCFFIAEQLAPVPQMTHALC